MSIAVSHHLSDDQLTQYVNEVARVTADRFVFLDAVVAEHPVSRLLWRYDRGAWPRSEQTLVAALSVGLELERVERFRVWHEYLLVVGRPRKATVG
jgi:hypothetical protein